MRDEIATGDISADEFVARMGLHIRFRGTVIKAVNVYNKNVIMIIKNVVDKIRADKATATCYEIGLHICMDISVSLHSRIHSTLGFHT